MEKRRGGREAIIIQSFVLLPNHQRRYANMKAQLEYMHIAYTFFFCTFGTDLYAQSVLINKTSTSELSWKFIQSALLVGYYYYYYYGGGGGDGDLKRRRRNGKHRAVLEERRGEERRRWGYNFNIAKEEITVFLSPTHLSHYLRCSRTD